MIDRVMAVDRIDSRRPKTMALPVVVVVAVLIAVLLPAAARGQAVYAERVTTGPGDTGERSYAEIVAASADGERVIFGSDEAMTADDRLPTEFDLFERVGETTRLLSPFGGQTGASRAEPGEGSEIRLEYVVTSQDATRVVFASGDRWTADDGGDHAGDLFALENGRAERLSVGPSGGTRELMSASPVGRSGSPRRQAGASPDARRVLFTTEERLTPDDADNSADVYAREGTTTTKISPGNAQGTEGRYDALVVGHSTDARRVAIATPERLTDDDRDDAFDIFLRDGATTTKLSPGNRPEDAWMRALSDDGHTALVSTKEPLLPADRDSVADLYRVVVGGGVDLITANPAEDAGATEPLAPGNYLADMTGDGTRVAFSSGDRHTPDDTDRQADTFLWTPERIVKVGQGNGETGPPVKRPCAEASVDSPPLTTLLEGISEDASRLVVVSPERLTADDRDDRTDLFEMDTRTGEVIRVSTGPSGGNADREIVDSCYNGNGLVFASPDGSRLIFETSEDLVPEDDNVLLDVYQRAGGVTTLLSPHPGKPGNVRWVTGARDGSVGYLETVAQLSPDDTNERPDGFRVRPPAPGVVVGPGPPQGGPRGGDSDPGAGGPRDGGGDGGTGTSPPRISLLSRAGTRLRLRSGALRIRKSGSGLRFVLSRAVPLSVRIERARGGRLAGGRCRQPTSRLRRRRACTRYVAVAPRSTLPAKAGRQVLVPGSRVPRGRRLRPGRHRITLAPRGGKPVRITVLLHR